MMGMKGNGVWAVKVRCPMCRTHVVDRVCWIPLLVMGLVTNNAFGLDQDLQVSAGRRSRGWLGQL